MSFLFKWLAKKTEPACLEAWLGRGWYGVESNDRETWVWSMNPAELFIPPRARQVTLHFSAIRQILNHSPQEIRIFLDGAFHSTVTASRIVDKLTLDCTGKKLLRLETELVRPCDFPGSSDTRPLGLCLRDYLADGKRPSAALRDQSAPAADFKLIPNGPPQTMQVEITTGCHLNCIMCSRPENGAGGSPHMRPEVWDRFFRAAMHVEEVNFLGTGESFINPRFTQYLRDLDDHGVATAFVTTGDLISEKKAAELGALRHFSRMNFSIDSPAPEIYRAIRGQALSRALDGLDRTLAAVRHPERIRVVSVVMKQNLESMLAFPELLERRQVRQFSMRGVIDIKGGLQSLAPEYNERDLAILRTVKADCEARGITVSLLPAIPADLVAIGTPDFRQERLTPEPEPCAPEAPPATPETRVCFDPWEMAMVSRDGLVQPCEVYHFQSAMGSLAEQEFAEIWTSDRYNAFRASLLCGQAIACRNCPRRAMGQHPLNLYAAELLPGQSALDGSGRRRLAVRNIGSLPWSRATQLNIGASRKKDRLDSALYHPGWIQRNRVSSFREETVAPGETATFEFDVQPGGAPARAEDFQLVVEGRCWLPNTHFTIPPKPEQGGPDPEQSAESRN